MRIKKFNKKNNINNYLIDETVVNFGSYNLKALTDRY